MTPDSTGFDPRRRLCPDGACLGVIGRDGRCTVCARAGEAQATAATTPDADPDRDDSPVPAQGVAPETDGNEGATDFAAGRKLCPDGTCVGIIGADDRCKVCGAKG